MTQPLVTIYGAMWCGDCRRTKRFLDQHGVQYTSISMACNTHGSTSSNIQQPPVPWRNSTVAGKAFRHLYLLMGLCWLNLTTGNWPRSLAWGKHSG